MAIGCISLFDLKPDPNATSFIRKKLEKPDDTLSAITQSEKDQLLINLYQLFFGKLDINHFHNFINEINLTNTAFYKNVLRLNYPDLGHLKEAILTIAQKKPIDFQNEESLIRSAHPKTNFG